ncbi:ATP-NADH kinase Yef1p [Trichomonascus vanleenenianus]|uniref:ATP-NADH kinase Yef1p n=1 Tax=Trichomonascus vanleenenianus TaxID=2268995 RepID=UPI003ECB8D57
MESRPKKAKPGSTCKVHNLLNVGPKKAKALDVPKRTLSQTRLRNIGALEQRKFDGLDHLESPEGESLSQDTLSEMVLSVRDLSKTLSNLSMRARIHNVLIVSKIHDKSLIAETRNLAIYLLGLQTSYGKLNVSVQDILRERKEFGYDDLKEQTDGLDRLSYWDADYCRNHPNYFDLVITLGGDGTVLYTSWLFQKVVPPILCFSMGSLGFMTEYDYRRRDVIVPRMLSEGFRCSLRMRFECTHMMAMSADDKDENTLTEEMLQAERLDGQFRTHTRGETFCILNDVVVDRGPNATITTTELYGHYKFLTSMEADGVVISTPSGSTAYSLSAGGSLVHPDIPGILVSPICPHTLSFRPIVLPDSLVIHVGVPYDARTTAWCSFDGKARVELKRGDFLTISASRYPFPMIQESENGTHWFERLSKTLHWNERKRQSSFS